MRKKYLVATVRIKPLFRKAHLIKVYWKGESQANAYARFAKSRKARKIARLARKAAS